MARRKRSAHHFAKVLGISLLLLMTSILGLQFYREWRTESILAAAQARGEPITLAQLDAWYPSPLPPDNAAPLYASAASLVSYGYGSSDDDELVPLVGKWELPAPWEPIPQENLAVCERMLLENAQSLGLLHEAAELPATRFSLDFENGMNISLGHLARMREGARFLGLEAIVAAEHNEPERAVEAILACMATGEAIRMEPVYLSQLVRVAILGMTPQLVERLACRTQPSDEQLARLIDALLATDDPQAQWRGLAGERCMALDEFERLGSGTSQFFTGVSQGLGRAAGALYSLSGVRAGDRRSYVAIEGQAMEAALLPYHERIAAAQEIKKRIENLPITQYGAKSLAQLGEPKAFVRHAAEIRTAALGLAIERYRRAQGAWPESLEALAPAYIAEVPPDPYTGAPLRYVPAENGFTVYSLGENGVDDGGNQDMRNKVGALQERGASAEMLDIAFEVRH